MAVMSKKKKPTGGRHSTPRQTMQFPSDWLAQIRAVASSTDKPALWYLLRLVKEDMERRGWPNVPPLPWEQPPPDPSAK